MSGRGDAKPRANAARGEAALVVGGAAVAVRPSFAALVAAEDALGPLFALVERAAAGELTLKETAALLWHCIDERPDEIDVAAVGEAVLAAGLAKVTPLIRTILSQILQGR